MKITTLIVAGLLFCAPASYFSMPKPHCGPCPNSNLALVESPLPDPNSPDVPALRQTPIPNPTSPNNHG